MCFDLGDESRGLRRFIKIHPSNNSDAAVTRDRPKSTTKVDIYLFTFGVCHSFYCTSLRRAHVPVVVVKFIENYYEDVQIRFTVEDFTTEWHTPNVNK